MPETVALVLAGGHVEGYGVLTRNRAKAALPFGGHFRIIDFALSNLSNSGITSVGIITHYLPASLIEHVGAGDAWDFHSYGRIVKIMPPFVGVGHTAWFRGTADAIFRNLNFVYDLNPDDVIILSGEHIYQMNYKQALEFHHAHNADLTIVGTRMTPEQLSLRFGYMQVDENSRPTFFAEKPKEFLSDFVSTGIFIFKREVLINRLTENAETGPTQNLAYDIIQNMVPDPCTFVYEFDGYWEYLENVNNYYETTMLLMGEDSPVKPAEWEIVTNLEDRGLGYRIPTFIGKSAQIKDSLISPGCRIEGTVIHSVISPGVVVEEGARVEDSIIMHDCHIKKGAVLRRVISDKDVVFENHCVVGGEEAPGIRNPELPESARSLAIMGKGAIIGQKVKIGSFSQVYPGIDLGTYSDTRFAPGINIK